MRTILISFFFILWSASAFKIRKNQGVRGQIKSINFDPDYNNSYIVSFYNQSEWFYKLDSEQNIVLTKNYYKIWDVIVNSENDVYLFSYDTIRSSYPSIWLIKNNSKKLKLLSYFNRHNNGEINSFIDKDENIFFNTKYGVSLLKPHQNIPLAIGNFEWKYFYDYWIDDSGDIYFKTIDEDGSRGAGIVTTEAKNKKFPKAFILPQNNIYSQKYFGRFGTYIYNSSRFNSYNYNNYNNYNYNNHNRHLNNKGYINKIEDSEDILLSEYDTIYKILHETDNRLFVLSEKSAYHYNIYYITKDDQVSAIDEVFSSPQINSSLIDSDKDGNVFIAYQKSIISLKENETESTTIEIPSDNYVSYILVDNNNDLWVLAGDLYIIKKGTDNATWLYSMSTGTNPLLEENKATKEIFVGSQNGLFVFEN